MIIRLCYINISMKKKFMPFLRVFVSLALIVVLLYVMRGKYGDIWNVLKGTSVAMLVLAVLAFVIAIAISSIRLKLIIEAQEIPINFSETLSLTFIGYFFNNFLPTSIGGDVAKAYYLSKKTTGKMGSFTAVFVDRVIGLFSMVFMAFVALLFMGGKVIESNVRYLIYGITVLSILAILFLSSKRFAKSFKVLFVVLRPFEEQLRRAYNSVHRYRRHTSLIIQSLVFSVISQAFFFISIGILARGIGAAIPVMAILLRMPIISMMSLLPSINGLGLREGAMVLFFGPMIGGENAFAVSILWLAVLLIVSIIGGMVYVFSPQFKLGFRDMDQAGMERTIS